VLGVRELVAAGILVAAVAAGCSATAPGTASSPRSSGSAAGPAAGRSPARCDPAGSAARARATRPGTGRLWPERLIAPEGQSVAAQAVDPAAGLAYVLVSRTARGLRGPFVLECISLRTGAARRGPVFPPSPAVSGDSLMLASGYLWVSETPATSSRPLVYQVGLRSLAVIRSLRLPGQSSACPGVAVAPGPAGSVWIGSARALLRVDTASGAVVRHLTLPAGVAVADSATDPAHGYLYLSVARVVKGGCGGNELLEYGARSGRLLAAATRGLITDSVLGAQLTAVPGGVWASFRTGMLGLTVHLRQRDLAMIAPPGPGIALTPATGIFHWAMGAAAIYGGRALWLATEGGRVACIDPQTGRVRAAESIPFSRAMITPLAADGTTRQVIAAAGQGLVQVMPPWRCWQ
jgi:hypothetical protein